MRVAFVHDYLTTYSGAERVLEQMLRPYPTADVYTLFDVMAEKERAFLGNRAIHTSSLQGSNRVRSNHRRYPFLYPRAIEQFDLTGYDLVISSSHAYAKGVLTGPDQLHLSYCYSPMRWAWDLQHQYLREMGLETGLKSAIARSVLHYLRMWDVRTAHGVDQYATLSHYIRRRIRKCYGRDATVISPPVDTDSFTLRQDKEEFYVTLSRMVPYKHVPTLIEAFRLMPDKKLVVIGDGPDWERAKAAAGPNVELLGHQPAAVARDHLQRAKAFLFAAEEDFGIAPLEAQACGTPVIAYGRGGALETVAPGTGLFFDEQTPAAVAAAVRRFEADPSQADARACRANAERFRPERFQAEFQAFVKQSMDTFSADRTAGLRPGA